MYKQKVNVTDRYNSRKEFFGEFSDGNAENSDYLWSAVYQNESDSGSIGTDSEASDEQDQDQPECFVAAMIDPNQIEWN